ncbi:MAG: hypothetical protein J7J77_02350 [Candidatus Cloacimonetes bacterium]|nr:hypothetical protein [Candidatus Cloacimonadota bacterium]
MNTLLFIGLIVIAIAWIIQLVITAGKSKNLSIGFVWLYFIGVVLLVVGNFGLKSNAIAILNIVPAVLALLTIILYPKKKAEKK